MADPAMASARDEAERLGTIDGSDVDRVECDILADLRRLAEAADPVPEATVERARALVLDATIQRLIDQADAYGRRVAELEAQVEQLRSRPSRPCPLIHVISYRVDR